MKVLIGRLSGDGSAEACRQRGAFGGSYPQIFFLPLHIVEVFGATMVIQGPRSCTPLLTTDVFLRIR